MSSFQRALTAISREGLRAIMIKDGEHRPRHRALSLFAISLEDAQEQRVLSCTNGSRRVSKTCDSLQDPRMRSRINRK